MMIKNAPNVFIDCTYSTRMSRNAPNCFQPCVPVVFFTIADLFWCSALHVRRLYFSWFRKAGKKYFCRFRIVCFTLSYCRGSAEATVFRCSAEALVMSHATIRRLFIA